MSASDARFRCAFEFRPADAVRESKRPELMRPVTVAGRGGVLVLAGLIVLIAVAAAPPAGGEAAQKQGSAVLPPFATCSPLKIVPGAGEDRQAAALGRAAYANEADSGFWMGFHGLLLRELVRQSVLIAARDELGLATRDAEVGDAMPGGDQAPAAEVCSFFSGGKKNRVRIEDRTAGKVSTMFVDLPVAKREILDLVPTAEAFSRREFPEVLRKLGARGKANVRRPDAPLPAGVEDLMSHMSYIDQLMALRSLHEAIRSDGESPARLAAVARAYALLGVLTEHHWHAGHKAFKARALLYAERLLAQDPNVPFSLWNRAFVRALVGLHVGALADLKNAQALGHESGATSPAWVPLIDAFLHYDVKAIATDRDELKSLSMLLHFLAAEFPWSRFQTLEAVRPLLSRDPDCFRTIDAICQVGGINDLHGATELGPQVFREVVPRKLLTLRSLPAEVRDVVARHGSEVAILATLRKAGVAGDDRGEPSWGVLGRLLAETRFVHVWRRLAFMRDAWGVPVDEFWAESRLSVLGHPFRLYLESFTLHPGAAAVMDRLGRTLSLGDLENQEEPMFLALPQRAKHGLGDAGNCASSHSDQLVHDWGVAAQQSPQRLGAAIILLELSPFSPFARASLIEEGWDRVKDRVEDWKKDPSADSPAILAAYAKRYKALGQIDDSQAMLRRYIKQSPDYWAYRMLADNEQTRGDMKRWQAALDDFVANGEDGGLDSARARVDIANHLMSVQEWDQALPYAEAAAETWAAWAMQCAGNCNEGLGEFDRAEFWFRNMSERYPQLFMQWFLYCKRNLRGDLAGATGLAEGYLKQSAGRLNDGEISFAMLLFDLANDPKEGLALVRTLEPPPPFNKNTEVRFPGWVEVMFRARFADALGETKVRDESWARIEKNGAPAVAKAAAMFRAAVEANRPGAFDREAFDTLLKSTDAYNRAFLEYFAACFLERRGPFGGALGYWDRASASEAGANDYVPLLALNAIVTNLKARKLDDSKLLVRRAWAYRRANQLALALKDVNEAIALDPADEQAYNLRGVVQRAAGDYEGAADAFTKMIEVAPKNPSAYLGRGILRLLQHKDDEAKADFERCFEVAPKASTGPAGMSFLALAQGRQAEAQRLFQQAASIDPSSAQSYRQIRKLVRDRRGTKEPRARSNPRAAFAPRIGPGLALAARL